MMIKKIAPLQRNSVRTVALDACKEKVLNYTRVSTFLLRSSPLLEQVVRWSSPKLSLTRAFNTFTHCATNVFVLCKKELFYKVEILAWVGE